MITEEWAKHIIITDFKAFNDEIVEQAKTRIIDIVGCVVGGASAPGCAILRNLVKGWDGKQEATILVHGVKAPAHDAAWVNAVMARSFDYGIINPYIGDQIAPGHVSETTIPTAITMAEWKRLSGKELITALILGEDITVRLSAASKYTPGMGWENTGIINKFGSVAISGKLLGLNERQLINAFGIVLDQLAGSFQSINDGCHGFKLGQGLAARDGIIAAEMAKEGWTGCKDPLTGKYGYFILYCQGSAPEILTDKLGKEYYGGRCTYKPYPGCGFTHPVIDCALSLAGEHHINVEEIEEIIVSVAPMHIKGPLDKSFVLGDFPQGSASFSYRYAIANALLRKSARLEHYTEEYIREPEVGTLIKKVRVIPMEPPGNIDSAEVKVKMKDGTEFATHVPKAKGNPTYRPLSKDEIVDKFWDNITFSKTISDADAKAALNKINRLEEVEDVTELVQLLVKNESD
jgi:2-methylcitrate dehydratase PrpD